MSAYKRYVQLKEHVTAAALQISPQRFHAYVKDKALRVLAEDRHSVQVMDADGEHHTIDKLHIQAVTPK